MKDGINIYISGEENNKSEIIYNNVVKNMKLTKEEQVEYLKQKVTTLEVEMKNKMTMVFLLLIGVVGLSLGTVFFILNIYLLGLILIFGSFLGVFTKMYLMYKSTVRVSKSVEYDKVEQIRQMLNLKLK